MQSIERYGLVALVFLAVTVAAVIMWDSEDSASDVAAAERGPATTPADVPRNGRPGSVTLRSDPARNLPLERMRPRRALEPDPIAERSVPGREGIVPRGGIAPARDDERARPVEETGRAVDEPGTGPAGDDRGARAPTLSPLSAPAERAVGSTRAGVYVVQPNETLSEISERELGTWKRWPEIVDLNPGLDPRKLRAGVRLVLPARGAVPPPASATRPRSSSAPSGLDSAGKIWRVGEGDNLWRIAARVLGDGARWGEIAAVNPGMDADHLTLGQEIRMPEGARARSAPPAERAVADASGESTPRRGRVR